MVDYFIFNFVQLIISWWIILCKQYLSIKTAGSKYLGNIMLIFPLVFLFNNFFSFLNCEYMMNLWVVYRSNENAKFNTHTQKKQKKILF